MRTSSDPDDTATDDVDWVRVSLLANVRYHISFDVGKCPQTAVIEGIYDSDGTAIPMTSSSKACSASMYFTPTTKGDYYIAVTGKGSQFVDKEDVDDDGRLKGTYHDRYPFTGADAILVVSLVVNYCTGESLDTLRDALTPLSEPPGGDLPAGTSASGRAPIGSSVTGNIESATDRDWFRVRFNGRIGERVYWLELKGADTGDGTLEDPFIVGIYDRQGTYISFSHVAGQFMTRDNDSGYGRNAITDFTAPCAGDYFVAVAGFEGSTGTYTLSVTDITDTSTSIPADDYGGAGFASWANFGQNHDDVELFEDELLGNLAPGLPATAPIYSTFHELFRLGVQPGRNYRVEVRLPETTGGGPANVDLRLLLGIHPYSDIGGADPKEIVFRFVSERTTNPGDLSLEFTATRTWYYSAPGIVETVIPSRWLASVDILSGENFEPGDVYTIVLTDITDSGDDYLGAEETTGTVAVGGSVTGNLEVDNDVDSFRVRLEADKTYRIRMRGSESGGGTLADPYVSIIATSPLTQTEFGFGAPINFNNDRSETEKDSELVITVYSSKDYLILAASPGTGTGTYTIEVEEVMTSGQRANSPATGGPGITGTVQAGETLTATTDGIEDEDGLTGAVFAYQWVRSGADIEGAASSTYTVTGDDEGKPIQVRVTFTDDAGNAESMTSYAKLSAPPLIIPDEETPPKSTATREAREAQGVQEAVETPPEPKETREAQEAAETPLTAAIHDAPESHDGQEDFTFELRFSEEPKEGFSSSTLRDHAFTVTGGEVAGARKLDGDSATPNIRWEISVSPDSNADVTVKLPATTDCDAQGAICTDDDTMLSSPLKFTVKGPPLTASFESVPTSHNGSGEFRFRITFSEELETDFSYKTLRDDHVFTVEGGSVTGARRLVKGSNIGWEIVVKPDSNGDVTITLPATTDCDAQGAICTADGRMLSSPLEFTVSGPGQ